MDYVHWPEAKVIRRVRLNSSHRPTGHVVNYDGDHLLPPPAELVIATHDSLYRHSIREPVTQVTEYHTFYLDETGAEMTDTLHGTLEEALEDAEHGFRIKRDEWEMFD